MENINIILCFASYQDIKGMYKNLEVNLVNFDKDILTSTIEYYYNHIGVEEFFLADVWTDDDDTINKILVKNYTECYQSFLNFVEDLKDNLEDIDWKCFEIACEQNSNCRDINYLIEYSENINIIDNIWDFFDECINVERSELATKLFQLQNEREAMEDLQRLGYVINESEEGILFEDNN